MPWIDYALLCLLASFAVQGCFKGLAQQAYSLVAWLAALIIGIFFSGDFAPLLRQYIAEPAALMAAAYAVLHLMTLTVAGLVRLVLAGALRKRRLSVWNRLGGMVLGSARGALFLVTVVLLAGLSALPKSPGWQQSKLIPPLQTVSLWISRHFQSEFTQKIHYP